MFIRLYHLIIKELLAALRDPKARGILLGPPILQIFILSYAITQEVKNVTLAVLNEDRGKEGYVLLQRLEHSPTFTRIVTLDRRSEIEPMIDTQQTMAAVVIPQDFSQKLSSQKLGSGQSPRIQVILDGRKTNAAPIVGGYISRIAGAFVSERTGGGVQVETRNWFNVNLDPRRSTVPALVCVLATVLGVLLAGLTIARERETGTFEQLLVSPLTPFEILVGKAVPSVILSTFSAVMLVGITIYILDIPMRGSFWLLIASMEICLIAVVGIGLFISSLSMTQQQAILGVILVLPPAIMLSGFATPVENMPDWMQTATIVNPVRWYLVIVKGVFMKGMGAEEVFQNCVPLALISAMTLTAAAAMFKRRME